MKFFNKRENYTCTCITGCTSLEATQIEGEFSLTFKPKYLPSLWDLLRHGITLEVFLSEEAAQSLVKLLTDWLAEKALERMNPVTLHSIENQF